MPVLQSLGIKLASDCIKWLTTQGINYLEKPDYNSYESELYKIIISTAEAYKQSYNTVTNSDKIHFCDSQVIILELLKFRLSKAPNPEFLKYAIQSDSRVEIPKEQEINQFLEIFSENIRKSTKLTELNIENNYKEEIFNISKQLNAVVAAITDLKKDGPSDLIEEWSKRLDEVTSNIEKFKPKTAFEILERLETRISEKGISVNNTLKGKIIYLKAVCLNELNLKENSKKSAELFINAYNHCPDNINFKANAGLAYFALGEFDKADKLANEILEKEEYNSSAWAIKCFVKGESSITFLSEVPNYVKEKVEFKAEVGYWLINKGIIKSISELDKLGFDLIISDENEPITITSKNKWYWITIINYLINKFYELHPPLSSSIFEPEIEGDINFRYVFKLLKKLDNAIQNSEIEDTYIWYKFQLLYMDYTLSQNKNLIPFIEQSYLKIKNKHLLEVIQISQVFNSIGNIEAIGKAISTIDDFGEEENEILCLFNSYNNLYVKNIEKSVASFKKYLALHDSIGEKNFYNLIQYINRLHKQSTDAVNEITAVINTKIFEPSLKELFKILTSFSTESPNTDESILEKIKNEINSNSDYLRYYVGLALYLNGKFNDVVEYLKNKVNKSKASDELKLYSTSLFNGNGDKLELLSILENWRKNEPLDYGLVKIELRIREVQRKWDIFIEVVECALKEFSNDESLIYALFLGYDNLLDTEGIRNNLHLIENKDFADEGFAIAISNILLKFELYDQAIELLYKVAYLNKNIQARSSYMTSLLSYPQEIFKDFSSIAIDTYIEYDSDGKMDIFHLTNENINTELGKVLLNKTVGEKIMVGQTALSGKQVFVTIKRIMNKYAALFREILKDAENPVLGYKLEVIKFENIDADSIKSTMIENFGAIGSGQKELIEKEFEKYYKGAISFTEIANSVFSRKRFDAYFHLISQMGKRFMSISPSISNKKLLNNESKFVVDVTSICLFFELSKELGLVYKDKFVISASLKKELVNLITDTKINPESKLSLNITTEGVTPYFYKEGFKDGRLKFLEEILHWIDINCEIDHVDEKLNFVLNLESKYTSQDDFLYDYVDNRLIVDRSNYFLLTNDTFYYRHLSGNSINIISPQLYLEKFYSERMLECVSFMLKNNYVGIHIYFETLRDEFINMISGKENKFSLCLENLSYSWNPNPEHVKVIVLFLKWLYLSNSIITDRKNQTAHTLFLSSLRYAPPEFGLALREELSKEFSLLGNSLYQIQLILLNALKMINSTR